MFCVLIQVFGGNSVTACRSLACKRDVALENLVGVTADLYVRTVAVEGLDPVRHARTIVMRAVSVVSTARALVWSWSHDTCLIAGGHCRTAVRRERSPGRYSGGFGQVFAAVCTASGPRATPP